MALAQKKRKRWSFFRRPPLIFTTFILVYTTAGVYATKKMQTGVLSDFTNKSQSSTHANNINVSKACSVFCTGPILTAVQTSGLYNDSKSFVDRPLLVEPDEALARFSAEVPANATIDMLRKFVETYFGNVGSDVLQCKPPDYKERPPRILANVQINASLEWALELNAIWPQLCRRASENAFQNPQRHTLLAPSHNMMVPGGRFRESYYWDTYWIVRGLIVSDMIDTACGVVLNLLEAAENYGFVPNGFRVYYLTRSQPPLLSEMVRSLIDAFNETENGTRFSSSSPQMGSNQSVNLTYQLRDDGHGKKYCGFGSRLQFLQRWLPVLDAEYEFWMKNRSTKLSFHSMEHMHNTELQKYATLNIYNASTHLPRPESFAEDITNGAVAAAVARVHGHNATEALKKFYHGVATAAETGFVLKNIYAKFFDALMSIRDPFLFRYVPITPRQIIHVGLYGSMVSRLCVTIVLLVNLSDWRMRDDGNITSIGGVLPNVIPVELNTYMLRMELNLAAMHRDCAALQHQNATSIHAYPNKSQNYTLAANRRADFMDNLLWNDTMNRWNDIIFDGISSDGIVQMARQRIYPFETSSSFLPLWAGVAVSGNMNRLQRAADAMLSSSLWLSGGVAATTAVNTGQQWDMPNAWSPIQHMLVEGLRAIGSTSRNETLEKAGRDLAVRWLQSNFKAYRNFGAKMFEKYDAQRPGFPGGGGEYASAQLGFGWTNGVALSMLDHYKDIDVS